MSKAEDVNDDVMHDYRASIKAFQGLNYCMIITYIWVYLFLHRIVELQNCNFLLLSPNNSDGLYITRKKVKRKN